MKEQGAGDLCQVCFLAFSLQAFLPKGSGRLFDVQQALALDLYWLQARPTGRD